MPEDLHLSVSRKTFFLLHLLICEICLALFAQFTPTLWAVSTMILKMYIQNVYIVLYHQRFSVLTSHQLQSMCCATLLQFSNQVSESP